MEVMTGHPPPKGKTQDQTKTNGSSKDGTPESSSGGPLALACHFGTFVRNAAQTQADVRSLKAACDRHGVAFERARDGRFDPQTKADEGQKEDKGKFLVAHQGETVWIKMKK